MVGGVAKVGLCRKEVTKMSGWMGRHIAQGNLQKVAHKYRFFGVLEIGEKRICGV